MEGTQNCKECGAVKAMDFYATLGASCRTRETILSLFREGMTGARLNLSHVALAECAPLLADFHSAA